MTEQKTCSKCNGDPKMENGLHRRALWERKEGHVVTFANHPNGGHLVEFADGRNLHLPGKCGSCDAAAIREFLGKS